MSNFTPNYPLPAGIQGIITLPRQGMVKENVHLFSGALGRAITVSAIPTVSPSLRFSITSVMQDDTYGPLGHKWRHSYEAKVETSVSLITVYTGSGERSDFIPDGVGGWTLDVATSRHTTHELTNPSGSIWELKNFPEMTIWRFDDSAIVGYPDTAGRLIEIEDRYGNVLSLNYSGGKLASIEEPQGRQILLTYTGDLVSSVTDPKSQTTYLTYDSDDNLTSVSSPEGCTVTFGFEIPGNHRITSITDSRNSITRYSYDDDRLTMVEYPDGAQIRYSYLEGNEAPEEWIGDYVKARFATTFVTNPDGQVFEYRFDPQGNLWRTISPSGHVQRFYWSSQQRFLYSSEGFPLFRDGLYGPSDNFNNRHTRCTVNERGDTIALMDPNGMVETFEYDSDGRLLSRHPGQVHYGVQGDWPTYYGADGIILCAFNEDDSDVYRAPEYLDSSLASAVTNGDGSSGNLFSRVNLNTTAGLIDPRAPILGDGSIKSSVGHWRHTGSNAPGAIFEFAINLTESKAFNLSLYSHSADHAKMSIQPLEYYEQYGRDLEIEVEDLQGVQVYRIHNNASGPWVTFPVLGDASNPVRITVRATGDNTEPVISAIAFDPHHDRRTFYEYTNGDLTKVREAIGYETLYAYNADGTVAGTTDARGKTTSFAYLDAYKHLTKITDHDSNETIMTHDANGNVLTITDANLNVTTMTYDGKGRLLTLTDALNQVAQEIEYDSNGNVLSVTDAKARQTLFAYDTKNQLVEVEDSMSYKVTLAHDSNGRLVSQTNARGITTTYSYSADGQLSQVDTPDGQRSTMSYDEVNQLVALTSPNGNQEALELMNLIGADNIFRNPGFENTDPNRLSGPDHWYRNDGGFARETTEVHSGDYSMPLSLSQTSWGQSDLFLPEGAKFVAKATVKRDKFDIVLDAQVRDFQGAAVSQVHAEPLGEKFEDWSASQFTFSVPGDAQTTASHPTGVLFTARARFEKNLAGWVDDMELFMLSQAYRRDRSGALKSVTTPDGAKVALHRDRLGRVIALEDPRGLRTEMVYDVLDRVTQLTKPSGETLKFSYNEVGALVSFIDGREQETEFGYDDLNRLSSITYSDATTEEFTYDAVGNLQSYTDNAGLVKTFTYDELNRLDSITYPDTSTVSMTYDEVGNLLTLTERNADITEYAYDALDRVLSVTRTKSSSNTTPEWELASTYDENGNRLTLSDASGELWRASASGSEARYGVARYHQDRYYGTFDTMDRPYGFAKGTTLHTRFEYDHEGRRTAVEFANGARMDVSFDIAGRPLAISTGKDKNRLLSTAYSYDIASNRTRQVTGLDTFDYRVDDDGKLVGEAINRVVLQGSEDFVRADLQGLGIVADTLELLSLDDTFDGDLLDCDRWSMDYYTDFVHPDLTLGCEIRQENGLHMRFPRGYSNRTAWRDDFHPLNDDYGTTNRNFYCSLEHRKQLTGDFDVRVELHDPQATESARIGLALSNAHLQSQATNFWLRAEWYPGNEIGLRSNVSGPSTMAAPPLPTTLRCVRSGSVVTLYVWDSSTSTWLTQSGWSVNWTDVPVWPALLAYASSLSTVTGTFKNFDFDAEGSKVYAASGTATSAVYDAGRNVAWNELAWQESLPAGTSLKLQLAFSDSAEGPWSYVGPNGTASTYYTTSVGEVVQASTISRYCRVRAYLTGSGSATPILQSVELSYSGSLSSQYSHFSYDEAGNLTEKRLHSDSSMVTETRTYDDLNQIEENVIDDGTPATWIFTHDDNGNLLSKTDGTDIYEYSWDDDNRLVEVELNSTSLVSYEYDSASRMIQRVEGATTTNYHWDGWDLVKEIKTTGAVIETTNYLVPQGEVLAFVRDGDWYYLHGDALSSTQLVTDENGDQVGRFIFGAWGEELSATETIPGLFDNRFVGGLGCRRDSATNLIYMRHRWYDCQLQRFISRDPIGLMGGANLYEYADRNPISNVDDYGLKPSCTVTFVDGSGFGGLDTSGVENVRGSYSNASSDELVQALENEPDLLIFTGHNRRRFDGKLRLRDGNFGVDEILARADRRPNCIFFNACNSFDRAPSQGEYPDSVIITVDRFVNMKRALEQSKLAARYLRGPKPLTELRQNPVPYFDFEHNEWTKFNFVVRNGPLKGCK